MPHLDSKAVEGSLRRLSFQFLRRVRVDLVIGLQRFKTGNHGIKDGSLHKIFEATMNKLKLEAAYFGGCVPARGLCGGVAGLLAFCGEPCSGRGAGFAVRVSAPFPFLAGADL
jgi:hypothetical protein